MFWVAIALLVILVSAVLLAVACKRLDVIAVPYFLAAIMAYMYGLLPARAALNGNLWQHVTRSQATWAILFPSMALFAFCIGWLGAKRRELHRNWRVHFPSPPRSPFPDVLYRSGLLLAVISIGLWGYFLAFSGGLRTFYGTVHGQGGRWADTTAYVHSGIFLVFPALALMIVALVHSGSRSKVKWAFFVILFFMMFLHTVLMASRGAFFQLTVTTMTAYMLASRKRIRPSTAFLVIIAGGVVILMLVGYRGAIFLGTSVENFEEAEFVDTTSGEGHGNEFVYHTAILATVDRVQGYGCGERYLRYLIFQPIPRMLWPGKSRMMVSRGDITENDVAGVMGWDVAHGAGYGLVADWYREWGVFSLVAWCALGGLFAWLYRAATKNGASVFSMVIYALVLGRSLHLFAQSFSTFFTNFLIAVAGMYVAYWICSRCARLSATPWHPYWGIRPCHSS